MRFAVFYCHDCGHSLCDPGIAAEHVTRWAHVVEKLWLYRRERKAMRGLQVQWSTDWQEVYGPIKEGE